MKCPQCQSSSYCPILGLLALSPSLNGRIYLGEETTARHQPKDAASVHTAPKIFPKASRARRRSAVSSHRRVDIGRVGGLGSRGGGGAIRGGVEVIFGPRVGGARGTVNVRRTCPSNRREAWWAAPGSAHEVLSYTWTEPMWGAEIEAYRRSRWVAGTGVNAPGSGAPSGGALPPFHVINGCCRAADAVRLRPHMAGGGRRSNLTVTSRVAKLPSYYRQT